MNSPSVQPARHPRPTASKRRRGFTLVEALATLVLIALVLPVAMRGLTLAAQTGSLAARRDRAVQLAESKLNEFIVTGEWQQAAQEGDFINDPIGDIDAQRMGSPATESRLERELEPYAWRLDVTDWHDVSLQQLTLTVFWQEVERERSVSLSTVVRAEEQ